MEVTQEALEEVRHCAMEAKGDAYSKFYDLFMKRLTGDTPPRNKAKIIVAGELCLHTAGHNSYPGRWLHSGRIRRSPVAKVFGELLHVGHACDHPCL